MSGLIVSFRISQGKISPSKDQQNDSFLAYGPIPKAKIIKESQIIHQDFGLGISTSYKKKFGAVFLPHTQLMSQVSFSTRFELIARDERALIHACPVVEFPVDDASQWKHLLSLTG